MLLLIVFYAQTSNGVDMLLTTLAINDNHVFLDTGVADTPGNSRGATATEASAVAAVGTSSAIATGKGRARRHALSVHHDEVACFAGDSGVIIRALAAETARLFEARSVVHARVAVAEIDVFLAAVTREPGLARTDNFITRILARSIILTG